MTPTPPDRPWWRDAALLVLAAMAVALAAWRLDGELWRYVVWSDRDLLRSWAPGGVPTMGAELSFGTGARIPGGTFHVLLGLPLWLGGDPAWAFRFQALLEIAGAVGLGLVARRWTGDLGGAVVVVAVLAAPVTTAVQERLWNPGFLPLFTALTWGGALAVVIDRDARGWLAWAAGLAFGLQMHLSILLLGATLLPPMLVWGPRGRGRVALGAAGVAAVALGPYVVHELATGLVNTRALLGGDQVASVAPAAASWSWTTAADVVGMVLGLPGMGWTPWGAAGLVAAYAVAGVAAWRDDRARRAAVTVLVPVGVVTLVYASSPEVEFETAGAERYLAILVPVAGLLAAGALAAVQGRGRPVLAAAVVVGLGAWTMGQRERVRWPILDRWALQEAWRGAVQGGGPLGDVVGRTVLVRPREPGVPWHWERGYGLAYQLAREGAAPPGAQPPPCFAVVEQIPDLPPPGDPAWRAFAAGVGVDPAGIRVDAVTRVAPSVSVVRWSGPALCPTSLTQRYVWTEAEHEAFAASRDPAAGDARALGDGRWVARWTVDAGELVVLVAVGDDRVTLHGNQLRGQAWNDGWYVNADLRDPRLVVGEGATATEVSIHEGIVGHGGVVTPIAAPLPEPLDPAAPLRFEAAIAGDVLVPGTPPRWRPVSVRLRP